jgi:hypothetical protein
MHVLENQLQPKETMDISIPAGRVTRKIDNSAKWSELMSKATKKNRKNRQNESIAAAEPKVFSFNQWANLSSIFHGENISL